VGEDNGTVRTLGVGLRVVPDKLDEKRSSDSQRSTASTDLLLSTFCCVGYQSGIQV
jgi:hypothetical protein